MKTKSVTQNTTAPVDVTIRFVGAAQAATLTAMLNLTSEELLEVSGGLRRAGCCKPDGGTCCVNKG